MRFLIAVGFIAVVIAQCYSLACAIDIAKGNPPGHLPEFPSPTFKRYSLAEFSQFSGSAPRTVSPDPAIKCEPNQ